MFQLIKVKKVITKLPWERYALILATLLLYASYSSNVFRVIEPERFQAFQQDSQSLVELKMLEVKDGDGISEGGYLRVNKPFFVKRTEFTYDAIDYSKNARYNSQLGLQGLFAASMQRLLHCPVGETASYLEHFIAFLQAVVLMMFLKRISRVIGFTAAAIGFSLFFFSPILTCFARNLYWVSFTHLVPFVIAFWMYPIAYRSKKYFIFTLCMVFLGLLVKCMCGYEFITAIILAPCAAVIYFAIRLGVSLKRMINHCIAICVAGSLGFAMALILHFSFLSYQFSSTEDGLHAIIARAEANTYGDFDPERVENRMHPIKLLLKYHVPVAFSVGTQLSNDGAELYVARISYAGMMAIAVVVSVVLLRISCRDWHCRSSRRRLAAIAATGIGSLATYSWFVLAHSHSQEHLHLNNILFLMPLIPTMSILFGELISSIYAAFHSSRVSTCKE